MDKKTFAQFLVVAAAILIGWWAASYFIFGPPAARRAPEQPRPAAPRAERPDQARQDLAAPRPEPLPVAPPPPEQPEPELREGIPLENGVIGTYWTNKGASLEKLELLDQRYRAPYREGPQRPVLALLRDFQDNYYSDTVQSVTFVAEGGQPVEVSTSELVYEVVEEAAGRLVFEGIAGDSQERRLRIRKTVTIEPGTHHYNVVLEFENASAGPIEFGCALRGAAGIERETLETPYVGTRVGIWERANSYDIAKVASRKLSKDLDPNKSANIAWAGVVNHYFVAVIHPENRDWISQVESHLVRDDDILAGRGRWPVGSIKKESDRARLGHQNATILVRSVRERLDAGRSLARSYSFIAAPKVDDILESYDAGLPGLIELGLLPSVSRVALAVLNAAHAVIPNYGVAILILTIIVRCALHPLTRKSQMSMSKMQKLQPQLLELQRKHGDDRQKLAQEQMEMYRRYGASPLSGCGPMLLQMPVFIALFGALRAAIELRHAGFLWVDDLSRPDTLFHLPVYLPLLGNELNLLPILMAAVMMLNQRFTPEPTTEQARQQHKMMKWFPLIFVVMLYHMPSGLCLYWTASTGIGLLERWLIEKKSAKMVLKPVQEQKRRQEREAKRKAGGPPKPKKPGLFARLQKMADEQPRADRSSKKGKKT